MQTVRARQAINCGTFW